MDAAEDFASLLHAVTDDPALAVRANRRQRVDRALEAIEGVVLAGNNYLKGFVIFVFTNFTCSHTKSLSRAAAFAAVSASISPVKIVQRSRSRHVPRFHHFHQVPESRDRPRK